MNAASVALSRISLKNRMSRSSAQAKSGVRAGPSRFVIPRIMSRSISGSKYCSRATARSCARFSNSFLSSTFIPARLPEATAASLSFDMVLFPALFEAGAPVSSCCAASRAFVPAFTFSWSDSNASSSTILKNFSSDFCTPFTWISVFSGTTASSRSIGQLSSLRCSVCSFFGPSFSISGAFSRGGKKRSMYLCSTPGAGSTVQTFSPTCAPQAFSTFSCEPKIASRHGSGALSFAGDAAVTAAVAVSAFSVSSVAPSSSPSARGSFFRHTRPEFHSQ
mmetsp:Transcript_17600/g.43932  ORF Transcript_17600/g.43932 Transcript_17600/m.43932 type:complete len:278 (+) Transcript_17600:1092-1925(+)